MQVLGVAPATTRTVDRAERRTERETSFSDWTIDGVPLRERVAARWGVPESPPELTRLWPEEPQAAVAALRALLGEAPPDFADGRVALLLCPIDQDVNCRALSVRVVRAETSVEWRDVGWQVDYEDFVPQPDEYGPLLSFRFDRARYETLLRTLLSEYEARVERAPARVHVEPPRRRWFRRARGN